MKKIVLIGLLGFLISTSSLFAGGIYYAKMNKEKGSISAIVGNNFVYIYDPSVFDNKKLTDVKKSEKIRQVFYQILRKSACSKEPVRKVINSGTQVIYIYPSKDLKDALFVAIDSCPQ